MSTSLTSKQQQQQRQQSTDCALATFDSLLKASRPLPANVVEYPNQIGGHGVLFGNKCRVLYQKKDATVYKSVQAYPKGPHEIDFYERVFDSNCSDPILLSLRPFLPSYLGIFHETETQTLFFCMNDVLDGLKHPSACDVKVGSTTYTPDASPAKMMVERAKYKWREQIGFLITGMKIYNSSTEDYVCLDIFHGRSLDPLTVYDQGIRLFLGSDLARSQSLARSFVRKLRQLADWFHTQRKLAFYSSSLLLAYDEPPSCRTRCDPNPGKNGLHTSTSSSSLMLHNELSENDELVVVRLVDFTHWHKSAEQMDHNFLYGLQQLINLFDRASTDTKPLPPLQQWDSTVPQTALS